MIRSRKLRRGSKSIQRPGRDNRLVKRRQEARKRFRAAKITLFGVKHLSLNQRTRIREVLKHELAEGENRLGYLSEILRKFLSTMIRNTKVIGQHLILAIRQGRNKALEVGLTYNDLRKIAFGKIAVA